MREVPLMPWEPQDPLDETLMTVEEVAQWLRVGVQTIRRMIRVQALPAVRVGRGWRLARLQVRTWLDAQRTIAPCPPGYVRLVRVGHADEMLRQDKEQQR
jgi:excisionase family DNA binding protein